jgi:hypothetical protein
MEINDLKKGEIYRYILDGDVLIERFIDIYGNEIIFKESLCEETENFSLLDRNDYIYWDDIKDTIREATNEEKVWLEVCAFHNEFIPKDEVIPQKGKYYEVYDTSTNLHVIGKVTIPNNKDNTFVYIEYSLRGNANYISVKDKVLHHNDKGCWCYKDSHKRSFKLLSEDSDDVKWLEACIKEGKYISKEEALSEDSFELPKKWCIKLCNSGIIGKWFDKQSTNLCYENWDENKTGYLNRYNGRKEDIHNSGDLYASFHSSDIKSGYTEITLEQFKKYVMKENNNFKHGELLYGLIEDNGWLWIHDSDGSEKNSCLSCVNLNTDYIDNFEGYIGYTESVRKATKEDIQRLTNLGYEVKDNKFVRIEDKWWEDLKEGDYVVSLTNTVINNRRKNYIYKWRNPSPFKIGYWGNDQGDEECTSSAVHEFKKATPEEIKLYEHAGKPVDITTYKINDMKNSFKVGDDGVHYKLFELVEESKKDFKIGDYVIMEKADGFGYSPENNGCLAKITEVDYDKKAWIGNDLINHICNIKGYIINPNIPDLVKFDWIPVGIMNNIPIVRKATQEEIDSVMKKDYQNIMDIEVGDTVRCISEDRSEFSSLGAGSGWEKDLKFKVTAIHYDTSCNIYYGGKNNNGVYSDAVRLVKKANPGNKIEAIWDMGIESHEEFKSLLLSKSKTPEIKKSKINLNLINKQNFKKL